VSNNIAIILARGGSKRLPGKNIIDFHGKPMVAWTIEAATTSEKFSKVLLSTDSSDIADIGREFGAEVPFLRESAADDVATSSEATLAALYQSEQYWGEEFSTVTQMMANCPLRDAVDIIRSVDNFYQSNAPAQISCFRYGWMNPWWAATLDHNGLPEYLFPDARKSRSQDLPELYCPSGAIWIADARQLKSAKTFYMESHIQYPLGWISSCDIDDQDDLEMANVLYRRRHDRD